MTRKRSNLLITFLLVALVSVSCNDNILFTDAKTIADETWSLSDVAEFQYDNVDSLTNSDVFFILRTGSDYPFRNIYLFVTSYSPDGKSITDTLEYFLADEQGKRYGKGSGEIVSLELPYKKNVFFPLKGTYSFNIRHGMRVIDLPGVYDFGIKITKTEK